MSFPVPDSASIEISRFDGGWWVILFTDGRPAMHAGPFRGQDGARGFLVWLITEGATIDVQVGDRRQIPELVAEDPWFEDLEDELEQRRRTRPDLIDVMREFEQQEHDDASGWDS